MKNNKIITLVVFAILVFPALASAQPAFRPLVGIPGISDPNANFNTYINTVYALSIAIAALLAVIKIIIAGVKWMLSDIVTSKQEAKSEIQGALLGLLIIASAFLILNEINPNLTKTSLVTSKVDRPTGYKTGPTVSTPPVGKTTTRPATDTTGLPAGDAQWIEIDGPVQPATLSLNPSSAPTTSNCAPNDTTCRNLFQSNCVNPCQNQTNCQTPRGQFTTSGGVVQCRYNTERRVNCTDRRVEIPRTTTNTGGATTPEYRNERNCYLALAMCQDRTPEMQRTLWEQGNVTCPVPY